MRLPSLLTEDSPLTRSRLWPRWLFLRALGLIFLSAFYSLAFQIHGLIGERGILPAGAYLHQVRDAFGTMRALWYAPTLLGLGASDGALTAVVATGIVCSILLTVNVWPRVAVALCTLLFLSCVAALQDFSSYQSDGMLLEAGFISCFVAPRGVRPKLGATDPPSRFAYFMLVWEWFRIYFESGLVKLLSGDPHWRDLTAMDEYYQNGPLPTWLGWYVQHFPHWYHAGTVILTLGVELFLVWMVFLPRPFRIAFWVTITSFVAPLSVSALALPERALGPFRIANAYGLFAVMTEARYEIEFQGSRDGMTWIAYPFRYKPQDIYERPGIYAPYQPRFDWNLWFASLGPWEQSSWVVSAQQRLLENSPSVLRLFRNNPFASAPPALVRTVRWQYWFTDLDTKRRTGAWWRRKELGMFTGVVGTQ